MLNSERRDFLSRFSAVTAASTLGVIRSGQAEPALETSQIRLVHDPAICFAPQYLAEELLRLEGFTQIKWNRLSTGLAHAEIEAGYADMTMDATPSLIPSINRGTVCVAIAGIHAGCFELFGHEAVRTIRDLKGKSVSVYALGGADHIMLASMLAYVGIDPRTEIKWVPDNETGDAFKRFVEHKVDAFMGFVPYPQELRALKVGHVILNTAEDRPWSQYFCCSLVASRNYVTQYPVATRRALRAVLKAVDICVREPQRVARFLVDKGYEPRYDIVLEVLKSVRYDRWRDSFPEDTFRFHSLRLREVGLIKSSPQKIIAQGTDWRFLNQVKKELKA